MLRALEASAGGNRDDLPVSTARGSGLWGTARPGGGSHGSPVERAGSLTGTARRDPPRRRPPRAG
jgi:hypothetical protein